VRYGVEWLSVAPTLTVDDSKTLRSETEATVFGEATSGKPNHFGDIGQFRLPNSKATVIYSTKYFRRLPNEDPESMFPDVTVTLRFADYAAQRDPVLEAAISI
jgi:hypothetical protein